MIPEREREALMRLTMCAREECSMCKYQGECNFDFQYDLATKNMNILAEALRKTEPTISKMEQVDEDINVRSKTENSSENPNNCKKCKWWNESYGCHWKEGVCHYVPKAIIPKQCVSCDSASRIIEAYSRGFEDGAEAAKTIKVKALHKDYIEPYVTIEDEPKTQMETQNSNLTFEKDECAKEYEELGLKELKELIKVDRKTEQTEREGER